MENIKKALKSPLARKQLLAILLFGAVITVIDTAVQLAFEFRQDKAFVDFQLDQIGKSHLGNLTVSFWELNEEQIKAQLNNALSFKDIVYIEIREGGKTRFSSGIKETSHRKKFRTYPMFYERGPIHRMIGTLYVEAGLDGVYSRLYKRTALILASQTVKVIVASFFILFIIHQLVTRHLIALAGYMGSVNVTNFDTPLSLNRKKRSGGSKDELDEVVTTIDHLRQAVNYFTEEQKRVERELRDSERKFRTFAEQALIGVCMVRDGSVIFANEGLLKIIGYTLDEFLDIENEKFLRLFHPEDRHLADRLYRANLKGSGETAELRIITRQGQEKWIQMFSKPVMSEEGTTICCIVIDTTDRRLYENEMTKFKTMTDKANYGASIFDTEGTLIYANECFATMLGYTVGEILGKHAFSFHHEGQMDRLALIGRMLQEKSQISAEVIEYVKKDGTVFPVLMNANLITDRDGNPLFYSSTTQDITELKRLEEQLKHSHKMEAIGTLAGGIAHDFNNILGIILGNSELSLEWIPDASPAYDHLQEIMTASHRAKDVVRQLLNFSRKSEDSKEPNQITFVVKEAVNLLRASIPKFIEIRYREEENLPMVLSNPTQIHQIVINLCTNAYHAMETKGGGVLEVDLARFSKSGALPELPVGMVDGDYVCLTVKDTGEGIPSNLIDQVFLPYFTTKETGKGTGMGLAVVHGLVKSHGGEILVDSEPGKGTCFRVHFPALAEAPSKEARVLPDLPLGNQEHILFVDDEKALGDIVRGILEKFGYTVDSFSNPLEALEHFSACPDRFDIVITDMSMPHMTGEQLTREIFGLRPGIPVVLCTGYNEDVTGEKIRAMRLKAVLSKPVNMRDLVTSVRSALDTTI